MIQMPPGRVMIDLEGVELNAQDRQRLLEPACAGVILFSRNYQNPEQLRALCADIKSVRDPALLIAVDHEGGRVQRFREGFSAIPAMRNIGTLWDQDRQRAGLVARDAARVIATELGACGIDFSFAPVLDIDHGCSTVIGDRAFHASSQAVIELAQAFIAGLNQCGMIAVGKHFPGHGAVAADTHHDVAVDHRELAEIERDDLPPFIALCRGALGGVMPAHVVYEKVDTQPAGFSRFWLKDMLRDRIGFKGVVFSDDLSMRAACVAGDAAARADAAFAAGCDVALVCNAPDDAEAVLHAMRRTDKTFGDARLLALHRVQQPGSQPLANKEAGYLAARQRLAELRAESTGPVA